MNLFDFEKSLAEKREEKMIDLSDELINTKYEQGEARIVTEQGAVKLSLVRDFFLASNYQLQPKYQRRITWNEKKRSKLIESFIMNIPVPPVFVYETEFDKYQVMDGLQRITTIIDFYNDKYELTGLNKWSELNGRKYSQLPQKIKEGIDRRQLSTITLLKESSKSLSQEEEMKKMVFERLNTGGVSLEDQEIRNALYNGPFNELCIELSKDSTFRKLWMITPDVGATIEEEMLESYDDAIIYAKNKLYRRMYDVELVLRYFAMRHIDEYSGSLSLFLDICLRKGNLYTSDNLEQLKGIFEETIKKADMLFGDKAFCQYTDVRKVKKWTAPQKMIYDVMMLALSQIDSINDNYDIDKNVNLLKNFYIEKETEFDGKKQSKSDIIKRMNLLYEFIRKSILGE
ncbi:MAG: DUF262 domain-containing protein [Lachnospiraceae bacterium]|nr:DUF262 domain-containing protein [Lachnospiraceae bacterium]